MVEDEETETFECPICQTTVSANATSCPECGAIFEMEKEIPSPTKDEEKQTPSSIMEEEIQGPSSTVEEEQTPLPSYLKSRSPEPLETEEKETEPVSDLIEEEEIIIEQEEAVPPQAEEEPPPPEPEEVEPEIAREIPSEQKITAALLDYTKQRRKRYFSGAIFLGIGLVLFVLLWLVVVYETIVTETGDLFLMEVLLILVGAGIFFVLGLYYIMTYPKSSLIDVFGSLRSSEQTDKPAEEY